MFKLFLCHFMSTNIVLQAIDYFCLTMDSNEDLPPLKDKSWSDYRLQGKEWKLIKLVHNCLKVSLISIVIQSSYLSLSQVILDRHNELSNEELATCTRVLPMLELLMSEWEELLDDQEYEPVHGALQASI